MARNVADAAFFAGVVAGRPELRDIATPAAPPRFGLYRTPMWDEAAPETAAALDRARTALERAGARVEDIAVPTEHRRLTEAQQAIMGFELVRSLAYERLLHSAELSPPLAQLLDAGLTVGAPEYDAAVAETAAARARLGAFFGDLRRDADPGRSRRGAARSRLYRKPGVQPDVDPARRAVRDNAGDMGRQRIADRHPAGRPHRRRRKADGGGAVRRARAGAGRVSPRASAALALLAAMALAGCGAFGPYSTVPAAATPSQPAGARVAICYNALTTSREAAQDEAQKECPAGTAAERIDTDYILQYCPLLLPARATFVCAPAK